MKIFIGADHGGFYLKEQIEDYLRRCGYDVDDKGNTALDINDDYPQFAALVAQSVLASNDSDARGIIICTGAQGVAMAANRFKGVRASIVWDAHEAKMTRNDNDSNVLCLSARLFSSKEDLWKGIIETWLATPFSRAIRHKRRVAELDELG
jgi:ribose 5-phosphate isomerase B